MVKSVVAILILSILIVGCAVDEKPQITSHEVPSEIGMNQEFQVSATATDDTGVKAVNIVMENGEKFTFPMIWSNGTYKANVRLLAEGKFTYTIVATDKLDQGATIKGEVFVHPLNLLRGIAFHDYNGNGAREAEEPVVPGIELKFCEFIDPGKFLIAKTDNNGEYSVKLATGKYKIYVQSNARGYNDQPYTYLNISREKFIAISNPLEIELSGETIYDIKLMQGFLTLPFNSNNVEFLPRDFFGSPRNPRWNCDGQGKPISKHQGTDFFIKSGSLVVSAASGDVIQVYYNEYGGNIVSIINRDEGVICTYTHLQESLVKTGDRVNRGDAIALSGASGSQIGWNAHLHFHLTHFCSYPPCQPFNPYRDSVSGSPGYWTKDNDPQYP